MFLGFGLFGPVTVRQFLVESKVAAEAFIELQPAVITVITLVLAVDQLVLTPEIGSIGKQQE